MALFSLIFYRAPPNFDDLGGLHGLYTYDPIWNRRKKIYTILSRRNRSRKNAAHFDSDGIGIKQIPQVLSLLKPFSEHHLHDKDAIQGVDEVVPLSVAYEIMRDWKMPELYNLEPMDEE